MRRVPPPTPIATPRIVAIPIAFNEAHAIGRVIDRLHQVPGVDVAVVDDGSTDGTASVIRRHGARAIAWPVQRGAGAAIRAGYAWARAHGYDICVILSGNDKDRPAEIPTLVGPIVSGAADLVQGSRFLPGGAYRHMPRYRHVACRYVHAVLFSLAAGRRLTDTTNGFRALRLSALDDDDLDLDQSWLDTYDLEPYLLLRLIRLGYAVLEVPVTKVYPQPGAPYTKMRAIIDWWSIVRPVVLLGLRLRT